MSDPEIKQSQLRNKNSDVQLAISPQTFPRGFTYNEQLGMGFVLVIPLMFFICIVSGLMLWFTIFVWEDSPVWAGAALLIIPMALLMPLLTNPMRKMMHLPVEEKLTWQSIRLRYMRFLPFLGLYLIGFIGWSEIFERFVSDDSFLRAFQGFGPLILVVGVNILPFIPILWTGAPIKRGDYETALRRASRLPRFSPPAISRPFYEGLSLMYAGRLDEAAERLQACIDEDKTYLGQDTLGLALEMLGRTRLNQGLYREAYQVFMSALRVNPNQTGASSGLAEVYLRRSVQPEDALNLTQRAIRGSSTPLHLKLDSWHKAEYQANYAWALALNGKHAGADAALEKAYKQAPRKFPGEIALLHYRAAQIAKLRGDTAKAADLLRQAQAADPHGLGGKVAGAALAEIQ
jgi:tetratricopeptide (TPR) repeat protein